MMSATTWDLETDVVIVGAGLAGYCAAYEAAGQGAEVLILEKLSEAGGSTALSGGFLAFAGTDVQRRAGIDDSEALLLSDLRSAGGARNDERLLAVYVDHQRAAYDWLRRAGVSRLPERLNTRLQVPVKWLTGVRPARSLLKKRENSSIPKVRP